ncbi:hypothetical protein HY641_01495, partial [Candidatus Woesearchaeota archaeon]|nr:hypothetical protein [Candidatus Woesearchaeota archaeon]
MVSYASLVKESLEKLWPQDAGKYEYDLKYSGKFSGYNGNIRLRSNVIIMRMSKEWRRVSKEIQIGLIQELLVRLFKKKAHTMNMDLYHLFLKRVHIAIPKDEQDPMLALIFDHLNDAYLNSTLERPNLRWGKDSTRKL